MSAFILRALKEGGLLELHDARFHGDLDAVRELAPLLERADLLLVGALADRIRAAEVGDVVRIFPSSAGDASREQGNGLALLRRVAIQRIVGPAAAPVRVDWGQCGLDVAQVALGFGASELAGPIVDRRGLPIADDATKKVKGAGMVSVQSLKKQEIEKLLGHAGRRALFAAAREHDHEEPAHA